ncbi:unnamed protein product [Pleuronectes platessa]|uniref:Uncharacterized protein n=1 Tax=Pleuronectes platessa TaxID=8262 RepID=A0A9N7YX65_PLEPL|nr:unnamed protein product [Pleuronectes platessa]
MRPVTNGHHVSTPADPRGVADPMLKTTALYDRGGTSEDISTRSGEVLQASPLRRNETRRRLDASSTNFEFLDSQTRGGRGTNCPPAVRWKRPAPKRHFEKRRQLGPEAFSVMSALSAGVTVCRGNDPRAGEMTDFKPTLCSANRGQAS